MELQTKQVEVLKRETEQKLIEVQNLKIANSEELIGATNVLGQIKTYAKKIKETKEGITKPMNEALGQVRDLFRPVEKLISDAEELIKGKMLAFQREERMRIEAEEKKIMARVEKGTLKTDTAMNKLSQVGEVQKSVKSDFGSISTKKIWKVKIVDETKIPREYLIPDLVKLNAIKATGLKVEGVEFYQEEIISGRGI